MFLKLSMQGFGCIQLLHKLCRDKFYCSQNKWIYTLYIIYIASSRRVTSKGARGHWPLEKILGGGVTVRKQIYLKALYLNSILSME